MKPFKGSIKNWWKQYPAKEWWGTEGLGYMICGTFVDHEWFAGKDGHTSFVILHHEDTGQIETLNSRYLLIGEAIKEPVKCT